MESIHKGRDVRALTAMLDRVYSAEQRQRVEMPKSIEEIGKLSREERHQLMRQLEDAGSKPFDAEAWRSSLLCSACGGRLHP